MGKNQSASGLTNIVQYDNNGNISFVSGSTTLMQISSSGAITTTGVISGSNALSSSYALNSGLLNETGSVGFATTGSLLIISSSQQQISASQQQISSSLLALTASYNALSSSYTALSASYNTASSSFSTRITSDSSSLSSRTTQIENVYATTGSNTFTGLQNFSNTCTPNSFTAGASIYTAGGLQVTQDSYFSSSVFIKGNVTVFGTQSVSYISSSQLDIGTNIITVNTSTPSVRYGGLSVFDSGSTGLTGSIFWDSELNRWIYVNASGSGGGATYGGGMFISGPRNSQGIGCEQGTTACMLLVGQGGDHLTSSMIYHDSTVTCIPGASITSTGAACFASSVTAKNLILNGTATTALDLTSGTFSYGLDLNNNVFLRQKNVAGTLGLLLGLSVDDNLYVRGFSDVNIQVNNGTTALALASTGVATFSNNILIGAGKYLGYSSTAYMTPEDNIQGARVKTPGAFLVESTGATFCSSVTANNFYSTGTTGFWSDAYDVRRNGFYADGTNLIFRAGTSGTGEQTRMVIAQATGNVGIGTCSPAESLEISGTLKIGNLKIQNSDGGRIGFNRNTATGAIYNCCYAAFQINGAYSGANYLDVQNYNSCGAYVGGFVLNNGNVGIGTNNPSQILDLQAAGVIVKMKSTTGTNSVYTNYENSAGNFYIGRDSSTAGSFGGSAYAAVLYSSGAYPMEFWTASSKKMVITSGGNVGIGTSSINSKLTIYEGDIRLFKTHIINCTETWASNIFFTDEVDRKGAAIVGERTAWDGAPMALGFETGGVNTITRRMTITSCGSIIIGNTANYSDTRLSVVSAGTTSGTYAFIAKNSTPNDLFIVRSDGLVAYPKINDFTTGNSPNTWINPSSSYGIYINTSSIRYKRDVINYDKGIDTINQLRPVYYKGKSDIDGDKQFAGFIAEEIHDLGLEEFVQYNEEGCPNSLAYPNMITLAVKAIQEQQCTICSQAAMINTLKTCLGIA